MPYYSYIAKNLKGESKKGSLEAENTKELANILRQKGLILISINKKKRKIFFPVKIFNRVSLKEKIAFTRNLRVMIGVGISLPRALMTMVDQTENKRLKVVLTDIANEITEGKNFSSSLKKHSDVFSDFFSSMVKVGEETGMLEEVLDNVVEQMEREHFLKSNIKGAMIYPAVIIFVMIIIGILMLVLVVPGLISTFEEIDVELPLMTKIVFGMGSFLANFWYLIPIIIIFLFFSIFYFLRTDRGKIVLSAIILKLPFFSSFSKKANSAFTSRNMGSLISSGVSIIKALEITSNTLSNVYYKRAMIEASEQVKKGERLSELLKPHQDIYPPLVIQMIAVGEETGKTSEMLKKLADFYEEEITRITKNLSSVIEPILMIIVGTAVGFFAISMIQPIYSMLGAIQ